MIVVVGVSHHSAPIEVREKVALPAEAVEAFLVRLGESPNVGEAFLVSTCNRVELVAVPRETTAVGLVGCERECVDALAAVSSDVRPHLYRYSGVDGLRHLLRVACSLDSLVVGEPQILGQLKQGFETGKKARTVGSRLHRIFSRVLRGAKSVRSQTLIGSGQVSIPSIAVDLASQIFGSLRGHVAVLVGAGEMGRAVTKLLGDAGAEVHVVGRSLERVAPVVAELGGVAHDLQELEGLLKRADVLVSSTSASEFVVTEKLLRSAKRARRGRNLFLIDLAVPRDIEPSVANLEGVFLYNVDDLSAVAESSAENRRREAERAAELVDRLLVDFLRWLDAEQATPVIKALRARLRQNMDVEFERSLRGKLRGLDDEQRRAVAKMLDSALNRMLHTPTTRLREEAASEESRDEIAAALSVAFELESVTKEMLARSSDAEGSEDEEEPSGEEKSLRLVRGSRE